MPGQRTVTKSSHAATKSLHASTKIEDPMCYNLRPGTDTHNKDYINEKHNF